VFQFVLCEVAANGYVKAKDLIQKTYMKGLKFGIWDKDAVTLEEMTNLYVNLCKPGKKPQ